MIEYNQIFISVNNPLGPNNVSVKDLIAIKANIVLLDEISSIKLTTNANCIGINCKLFGL